MKTYIGGEEPETLTLPIVVSETDWLQIPVQRNTGLPLNTDIKNLIQRKFVPLTRQTLHILEYDWRIGGYYVEELSFRRKSF